MKTKAENHASGSAGVPPAGSRVSREPSNVSDGVSENDVSCACDGRGEDASTGRRDACATRGTPSCLRRSRGRAWLFLRRALFALAILVVASSLAWLLLPKPDLL